MADKSPRQSMSKKSGKSLKEKRAAKRAHNDEPVIKEMHPNKKR
jgi:hypothetical protein